MSGATGTMSVVASTRYREGAEHWLQRLAGRSTVGGVHPEDLASRLGLESEISSHAGPGGITAPNRFAIRLSRFDLTALSDHSGLTRDLAGMMEARAVDGGQRLEGPVRVWLEADRAAAPGSVAIRASHRSGRRAAWGILEGEGRRLEVRLNRSVLGSGPYADVPFAHHSVSPRHAVLWLESGSSWIQDLDSTEGTLVDNLPASGAVEVHPSSRLTIGSVNFRLQVL